MDYDDILDQVGFGVLCVVMLICGVAAGYSFGELFLYA